MSIVLQLSLCVVIVIQLTSSQSICDVTPQPNNVSSCERSEQSDDVLRELVTLSYRMAKLGNSVCQLQRDVAEVKTDVGEVKTNMSQLERGVGGVMADVGELKTSVSQLQRDISELKAAVLAKRADCPANFTYISSVNGCYKVVNRNLSWTAAGLECRSLHKDAHLLVINDVQEQLEVAGFLESNSTSVTGCYEEGDYGTFFWTAGQRWNPSKESAFVWRLTSTDTTSDRVSKMSYDNWRAGQPDYYNQQEACMHLMSGRSYTWNDYICSTAVCSVCELDI